ncbi:MAG: hydroxymethylbilane synthase [Ginsengibacter sp.]
MPAPLKIGTRESELAKWQANLVESLLHENGVESELVYISSEGDIDLVTPLYDMGVQGIFTKTLDVALLNKRIDIAVHSYKDVPTQLPIGIQQAAVLKRGSYKDVLVLKDLSEETLRSFGIINDKNVLWNDDVDCPVPHIIATSSIRRKAQWLHRFPKDEMENLRGNVNTRLKKLHESNWHGAIFAAAGLERIGLRSEQAIDLDWMLPAPAQGAILIVCRTEDEKVFDYCRPLNDEVTEKATAVEKSFLKALMGGCSTPIGALAKVENDTIYFTGNICSTDGNEIITVTKSGSVGDYNFIAIEAAEEIKNNPAALRIMNEIHHEF